MGRPLGSPNKEKPFRQALSVALHSRPLALRRIADRLLDSAENGDLHAAREVIDRLDGRPSQVIDDYKDVPIKRLSDEQIYAMLLSRGLLEPDPVPKALPAPRKFSGAPD